MALEKLEDEKTPKIFKERCRKVDWPCFKFWASNFVWTAVTVFDIITDFQYLISVPMYSSGLHLALAATLALPFCVYFILIVIVLCNIGDSFGKSLKYFVVAFLALSTGNMHLQNVAKNRSGSGDLSKSFARYANGCLFGLFEDLPQFMFQMLNTMLLGQQMTAVQILSPTVSAFALSVRAINVAKPREHR